MNKKSTEKQRRKERIRATVEANQNRSDLRSRGDGSLASWFSQHLSRRSFGKGMAWTAALAAAGLTVYQVTDDEPEITLDSLELQRKSGWNIGSTNKPLAFEGSLTTDSQNKSWQGYDPNYLISIYQPRSSAWQPFFVPTLLQSLSQSSLSAQMRPIRTSRMTETYERGQGLRELLSQTENAQQTLIIAELPGPQSVALGAALADTAELVPGFDNWPHPLGVVKAHETLGAMVYYANEIAEKKAKLKENAPALLLLDSNRLTPYQDEDTQFDNRFLAKLPPADQLKQRGIQNVMYVVKDETQKNELDDINEDLVELQKQGIGVQMLRLSEFKPYDDEIVKATADGTPTRAVERHYYYGGSPLSHLWFYSHYYYRPYPTVSLYRGGGYIPVARPATAPSFSPPAYRPVTRPTVFSAARVGGTSGAGVGKARPSGFGRTSVRMSGGQVTGVRSGRSGSYGRGFGGFFGG
jgi:hypothetical protein